MLSAETEKLSEQYTASPAVLERLGRHLPRGLSSLSKGAKATVYPMLTPAGSEPYAYTFWLLLGMGRTQRLFARDADAGELLKASQHEGYYTPRARERRWYADAERKLYWVADETKALLLDELELCCVALPRGSWNARIADHVTIANRDHVIVGGFRDGRNHVHHLARCLYERGARTVRFVRSDDHELQSIDDYYQRLGAAETLKLLASDGELIDQQRASSAQDEDDDERHERRERFATEEEGIPLDPDDVGGDAGEPTSNVFGDTWKTLADHGGLEWFAIAPPRRRWLLELPGDNADTGERSTGVLPLGKVGMLAAQGAAGKTMALVQLAIAVATGREWLDTYTTPNPGHVLLALGEEDIEEVRRRIYAAAKAMRLTDEQRARAAERIVALPLAGTRVALTEAEGEPTAVLTEMRSRLESSGHEWRLIVLDPLSRFAGIDVEKDNAAATGFMEAVETLLTVPGQPTVLLAHHTNKNSRAEDGNARAVNAVRGASGLTDAARWVAQLDSMKDTKDRVVLAYSKLNYSGGLSGLTLVRGEGGALRAETDAERKQREAQSEALREEQKQKRQTKPAAGARANGRHSDSTDDSDDFPS